MPAAPARAAAASKLTRAFDRARGRGHQQLQDCDDEALQTNPTSDSQWSSQGRAAAPGVNPGSWAQHRSGACESLPPGMAIVASWNGASSSLPVTPSAPAGSASSPSAPEPASAGGKLSRAFGRIRGGDGRKQLLRQQQEDSGSSQVSDDVSSFGSKFGGSAAAANPVSKSDVVASTAPEVAPSGHGEASGTMVQGTSAAPPPWLLKSHLRSAREAVPNYRWRREDKSRML